MRSPLASLFRPRPAIAGLLAALCGVGASSPTAARELRVVVTTPDLASLTRAVGGDEVSVKAMARGREDPHFVEAKPSFIRALSRADLFIQVGLDLEIGWVPPLIRNARNRSILPGGRGYLLAAQAIVPLEVRTAAVDRSQGDVHVRGNPHYLVDPVNGLRVARLIRDRLIELRPESRDRFEADYAASRSEARRTRSAAGWRRGAPSRGGARWPTTTSGPICRSASASRWWHSSSPTRGSLPPRDT